jgi:hypothetical protein
MAGRIGRGAKARRRPHSDPGASGADPLLETKLFVPPRASSVVERPRLLARLAEGLHRPLTLIAFLLVGLVLTIVAQVPHPVGSSLANVDAFTAYAATSVEFYAAIHLAQFLDDEGG